MTSIWLATAACSGLQAAVTACRAPVLVSVQDLCRMCSAQVAAWQSNTTCWLVILFVYRVHISLHDR